MAGNAAADGRQANSAALPWPAGLLDGLHHPRVAQLTGADAVSAAPPKGPGPRYQVVHGKRRSEGGWSG